MDHKWGGGGAMRVLGNLTIFGSVSLLLASGVTMGGGGHMPLGRGLCSPGCPPLRIFQKISLHLRLQNKFVSSIDMPPKKKWCTPSAPPENWMLVTPLLLAVYSTPLHSTPLHSTPLPFVDQTAVSQLNITKTQR